MHCFNGEKAVDWRHSCMHTLTTAKSYLVSSIRPTLSFSHSHSVTFHPLSSPSVSLSAVVEEPGHSSLRVKCRSMTIVIEGHTHMHTHTFSFTALLFIILNSYVFQEAVGNFTCWLWESNSTVILLQCSPQRATQGSMSGFIGVTEKPLKAFRLHIMVLNVVSIKPTELHETGLKQRREAIKRVLHCFSVALLQRLMLVRETQSRTRDLWFDFV